MKVPYNRILMHGSVATSEPNRPLQVKIKSYALYMQEQVGTGYRKTGEVQKVRIDIKATSEKPS